MVSSPIDWATLRHAYGAAADIPALLKAAETAPAPNRYDQEPWFSLWSALCHQGDVYSASYAALPELVRIGSWRDSSARAACLLLAGCIELGRHEDRATPVPAWLIEAYEEAVGVGAEVARASLDGLRDPDDRRAVEIALAAFTGQVAMARRLLGEDEEAES